MTLLYAMMTMNLTTAAARNASALTLTWSHHAAEQVSHDVTIEPRSPFGLHMLGFGNGMQMQTRQSSEHIHLSLFLSACNKDIRTFRETNTGFLPLPKTIQTINPVGCTSRDRCVPVINTRNAHAQNKT